MSDTLTVVLAYPRTIDGHQYEPDASVELPADDARLLVAEGYARWPASNTTPTNQPAAQQTAQEA